MRATPGFVPEGALEAPPDVVAAIAAAVELYWPKPAPAGSAAPGGSSGAPGHGPEYVWRFSGRWWNRPVPLRRDRPWTDR